MDRNKGYLDLFNAAIVLNKTNRNLFEFNFAGRFDIQKEEESLSEILVMKKIFFTIQL